MLGPSRLVRVDALVWVNQNTSMMVLVRLSPGAFLDAQRVCGVVDVMSNGGVGFDGLAMEGTDVMNENWRMPADARGGQP